MSTNLTTALWTTPPGPAWNGVFRLVVLSAVATGGTMGGVFVISAVTVVEPFQVRGNVYLVSLALANLLVTLVVLPASCVAILAGWPHAPNTCRVQWLATVVCFLASVLSFMLMAIDNCLGLGSFVTYTLCCSRSRVVLTVLLVWTLAVSFAAGQHVMEYGPSFCQPGLRVWPTYHATAAATLIILPLLIAVSYFTGALFKLRAVRLESEPAYVMTDQDLLRSNMTVFVAMLVMWLPCAGVAGMSVLRPVSPQLMDTVWWLGLSYSCVYSYLYAATNRDFRDAFNKLFYYCCCKSHVTFTRRSRESRRGVGLRVHIIPGLNLYAQRKDTTACRSYNHKGQCDL